MYRMIMDVAIDEDMAAADFIRIACAEKLGRDKDGRADRLKDGRADRLTQHHGRTLDQGHH